jgi:fructose-1,6-bisphosphatase/inositol monophosphatase family enzyme
MDAYAYALLAAGHIDIIIEAGLKSYDIQAPIALVEAAGGVITNWTGDPASDGGQVLACGDKRLQKQILDILCDYV